MDILIIQPGETWQCVVSTSLIKGLKKKYEEANISVAVANRNNRRVFLYHPDVDPIWLMNSKLPEADLLINLGAEFDAKKANAKQKIGFGCTSDDDYEVFYGEKKTDKNILQFYYSLVGLTWRGEGYDCGYFPRSKSNKKKTGVALADSRLRSYVFEKLSLEKSRIWYVPQRRNFFKKADEINRCQNIVTDDLLSMHIAIYLRKYVYFLTTKQQNIQPEFFGRGQVIPACDYATGNS